jgi:thiamine biosynthesis lipoprotein
LNLARRINMLSDGVFDPCLPSRPGRLQDIEVANGQLLCHEPVALDFGGFAKGYAVDCAVEALLSRGCTSGLVNAGGDLRVFGPRVEPVLLRGPAGRFNTVSLGDGALAVSDTNSKLRPAEHQGYYIRTSAAAPLRSYAAVIARQAVLADASVKCVLLCPEITSQRVLEELGATQICADPFTGFPPH